MQGTSSRRPHPHCLHPYLAALLLLPASHPRSPQRHPPRARRFLPRRLAQPLRHEFCLAFSCGARTVCPSCSGRRMAAASEHVTVRFLPDAPVRQFVVSVPRELRLLLESRSEVLSAAIPTVMRVVLGWYRKRGFTSSSRRRRKIWRAWSRRSASASVGCWGVAV